jgi:hypothetical protein
MKSKRLNMKNKIDIDILDGKKPTKTAPLTKVKYGTPNEYSYRGNIVFVDRNYNFNNEYCISSFYYSPEHKIGSHNRNKFKVMMDRRIFKDYK